MEQHCEQTSIRILIVDDHPIVRAGLATLLKKVEGFRLEGGVDSADDALTFLDRHSVDVVLLDLRMPKMTGLEALPLILQRQSAPKVLILSSFDYEEEIYRAAQAGAHGYLMKDATRAEIIGAISAVAAGQLHFPKGIELRIAQRKERKGLSQREQEVLKMLCKGLTNKEIGRVLLISQITVRNHVSHILEKLDASDRTEAVSIAMQQGVISIS